MPKPKKGESEQEFVSRCIRHRQHETGKQEDIKQSAAICYSIYRREKKKKKKK